MSSKLKFYLGLLIVIAGFLVVRIALVLRDRLSSASAEINSVYTPPPSSGTSVLTRDSDKDGLPDREEIIYGTDPFKPDTDGDSYVDGEEVSTGHDPLDADDNGKTRPGNFGSLKPNLTTKTINLTIASLVESDGDINPAKVNEANIDNIISSLNTQAGLILYVEPVKDSDLKISNDNSSEAVSRYLATIGPLFREYLFNTKLLSKMANSDADLRVALEGYQKADQILRLMEVPSSWKNTHKDLINISDQIILSGSNLTKEQIETDPIKSLFALQQLQNALTTLPEVTAQMTKLAKEQNLSIKSSLGF